MPIKFKNVKKARCYRNSYHSLISMLVFVAEIKSSSKDNPSAVLDPIAIDLDENYNCGFDRIGIKLTIRGNQLLGFGQK